MRIQDCSNFEFDVVRVVDRWRGRFCAEWNVIGQSGLEKRGMEDVVHALHREGEPEAVGMRGDLLDDGKGTDPLESSFLEGCWVRRLCILSQTRSPTAKGGIAARWDSVLDSY